MPRPQVYGKRSRAAAARHNFAIFDSPEKPVDRNPSDAAEVTSLVQDITGLSLREYAKDVETQRRRTALGEKDGNAVVKVEKPVRRKARKVVEDEENEGPEEKQAVLEPGPLPGEPVSSNLEGNETVGVAPFDDAVPEPEVPLAVEPEALEAHEHVLAETDELPIQCRENNDPSHVLSNEIAVLHDEPPQSHEATDVYSHHCAELLQLSSHGLTSFQTWSSQLSAHFRITKIAEASFGEVYRLSLLSPLPGLSSADESVFKIIPLQPPACTLPQAKKARSAALKKAEAMSKPEDVANEVKLLQRMRCIPGFTNFRDIRILQGRPPKPFVEAFRAWNSEQKVRKKETSHFPDPSRKASYGEDQLWAVIEMQDAGTDLEQAVERGECSSIWSVWDVFWQVVLTLAKGEEGAEFEHRDLHLGNICVRRPEESVRTSDEEVDTKRKLGFTGLETTVIDYTISRCQLSTPSSKPTPHSQEKDKSVAYLDLSTPNQTFLFQGDSTEEYQYDIYRYMRSAVYLSAPLATPTADQTSRAHEQDVWRAYHPVTNLVWLHFLLYKLLEQLDWPSALKAPAKKNKDAHARWKRANDLEHALLRVQDLLDPGTALCRNELKSASDVVGLALTEGWLDVADVVGADGVSEVVITDMGDIDVGADLLEEVVAVGEAAAPPSSDALSEPLTHLQINVDVIEEHGLDVAQEEARQRQRQSRRKR